MRKDTRKYISQKQSIPNQIFQLKLISSTLNTYYTDLRNFDRKHRGKISASPTISPLVILSKVTRLNGTIEACNKKITRGPEIMHRVLKS